MEEHEKTHKMKKEIRSAEAEEMHTPPPASFKKAISKRCRG
jgi:hypothetical protein